eukprot:1385754-Pyramimonas_sp.AAC.1
MFIQQAVPLAMHIYMRKMPSRIFALSSMMIVYGVNCTVPCSFVDCVVDMVGISVVVRLARVARY